MTTRVLFVNEGDLGGAVLGHVAMERAFRAGLAGHPEVEARFIQLPPMGWVAAKLAVPFPVLNDLDLDLKIARWHAVQARRTRRLVLAELARWPADVLHVGSHTIAFGLTDLARRIPLFVSVDATVRQWVGQGLWQRRRPWSRALELPSELLERRLFRVTAGAVCFSPWSMDGVHRAAPATIASVVHPGIDLGRFRPAPAPRIDGPLRVLFVGGRFQEKGGADLVEAVRPWLGSDVVVDAVTAADVPPADGLTVHRLGHDDDRLIGLYQAADVLCLPSHADAVPWVVPEALACGTPVLVSDVGALPTMFDDAGWVVPARRPDLLRTAIDGLRQQRTRSGDLRARARGVAEARYDRNRQASRLAELLSAAGGEA